MRASRAGSRPAARFRRPSRWVLRGTGVRLRLCACGVHSRMNRADQLAVVAAVTGASEVRPSHSRTLRIVGSLANDGRCAISTRAGEYMARRLIHLVLVSALASIPSAAPAFVNVALDGDIAAAPRWSATEPVGRGLADGVLAVAVAPGFA